MDPIEHKRTDRAHRHIKAPADVLWAAFSNPAAWIAWLPPRGMHGEIEHFDFRPGGAYRLRLVHDSPTPLSPGKASTDADVVEGRFIGIEPGRRLVQDVSFPSDDPAYSGTMRMTWSLEPAGPLTRVVFVAENVPAGISAEDHQAGFLSTLENLAAYVAGEAPRPTSSSRSS
ncbi:MAG: SRPBCC domain-containing protein [Rhizobiaceae bacterium]|nr:SRPBCC domain-containing protein [Rhizobiaceae bacterium]